MWQRDHKRLPLHSSHQINYWIHRLTMHSSITYICLCIWQASHHNNNNNKLFLINKTRITSSCLAQAMSSECRRPVTCWILGPCLPINSRVELPLGKENKEANKGRILIKVHKENKLQFQCYSLKAHKVLQRYTIKVCNRNNNDYLWTVI